MSAWAIRATTVLLAGALAACASDPVTSERETQAIPEAQVRIGEEQYVPSQQMQGGPLSIDPDLTAYVQRVGRRLAQVSDRELPYEFVVLNNSVPNAWALPGGKIAVSRGLLQELRCEAELAAVLGHQLTHAAAPHDVPSAEPEVLRRGALASLESSVPDNQYVGLIVGRATLGANLITQKQGRDAEREADRHALISMKRAGYDPAVAVELQRTFVRLAESQPGGGSAGLFASHPPTGERVQSSVRTLAEIGAGGEQGCEEYAVATVRLRNLEPAYEKYDAGVAALRKGDLTGAQANARAAFSLESREPKFHELLGDVALARNEYEESLAHYAQASDLNPDYFKPYLGAGLANYQLRRHEAATKLLDRSMSLLPTATGAYHLGELARQSDNPEEAVRYFQLAAQSDSDLGRASARELIELDLPRNPGRYVRLEPRLDRSGRIWMRVTNRAPVAVDQVLVSAALAHPAGGLAQGPVQVGTGGRTLGPNEVAQVVTPLGPLRDPRALQLVRAEVQQAQVAR